MHTYGGSKSCSSRHGGGCGSSSSSIGSSSSSMGNGVVTAATEKNSNHGPGNWCSHFGPMNNIRTSKGTVLAAKSWAALRCFSNSCHSHFRGLQVITGTGSLKGTNFVTWRALVNCAPKAAPLIQWQQQQQQARLGIGTGSSSSSTGSSSSSIVSGVRHAHDGHCLLAKHEFRDMACPD